MHAHALAMPAAVEAGVAARDVSRPLIYQPYLDAAQRAGLSPLAVAFDISFNTGPATREYELFRHLYAMKQASGFPAEQFWGLVSSKFEHKSPVTLAEFAALAEAAQRDGYDCFVLNPMIGSAAIHTHVWEQGILCGHRGMEAIFLFLRDRGYPVDVAQGPESFAFCNYVCGNARFWSGYFAFIEGCVTALEVDVERGGVAGRAFSGASGYQRDPSAAMRPFVIERLLGNYLQAETKAGRLRAATHQPSLPAFTVKFGPRVAPILWRLYEMKCQALAAQDEVLFDAWLDQRQPVLSSPVLVWQLDDPPGWLPAAHVPSVAG